MSDQQNDVEQPKGEGRLEYIRSIVDRFQSELSVKSATVGDFIKLVGLERDLQGEEPIQEVKITWVQSLEQEPAI